MTEIGGLPAHALLVHIIVIVLPLTALAAIVGSLWPAAQRKLTFLTPLGALVGLIMVPITTSAGSALATKLELGDLIENHMTLGSRVLPWAIAFFVITAAQWAYFQYLPPKRWLTIVLAAVVIIIAVGTAVQVVLTGDSGARAVWGWVYE